eukprot:TRINITY_DN2238_c0_g1_i4.p1 TRINITY_DN2238_c0_g1~~TRINITY_DN2238_c0_g1_i4.p1  ORF type:complete len:622 (+),score=191.85 TRINITY_DN2238_c0_g1_i4:260-2125(+)
MERTSPWRSRGGVREDDDVGEGADFSESPWESFLRKSKIRWRETFQDELEHSRDKIEVDEKGKMFDELAESEQIEGGRVTVSFRGKTVAESPAKKPKTPLRGPPVSSTSTALERSYAEEELGSLSVSEDEAEVFGRIGDDVRIRGAPSQPPPVEQEEVKTERHLRFIHQELERVGQLLHKKSADLNAYEKSLEKREAHLKSVEDTMKREIDTTKQFFETLSERREMNVDATERLARLQEKNELLTREMDDLIQYMEKTRGLDVTLMHSFEVMKLLLDTQFESYQYGGEDRGSLMNLDDTIGDRDVSGTSGMRSAATLKSLQRSRMMDERMKMKRKGGKEELVRMDGDEERERIGMTMTPGFNHIVHLLPVLAERGEPHLQLRILEMISICRGYMWYKPLKTKFSPLFSKIVREVYERPKELRSHVPGTEEERRNLEANSEAFFFSSHGELRFLSAGMLLFFSSSHAIVLDALEEIHRSLLAPKGRILFLQHGLLNAVHYLIRSRNKKIPSVSVSILLSMVSDGPHMFSFLKECANDEFFRSAAHALDNATLPADVHEGLCVILEKISAYAGKKSVGSRQHIKSLFESHGLPRILLDVAYRRGTQFVGLNVGGIMKNLGLRS